MIVKDVTKYLEKIAPLHLQEGYDNSGLQVGDLNSEINGVLISLDDFLGKAMHICLFTRLLYEVNGAIKYIKVPHR